MFEQGKIYERAQLHSEYGGQPHARISTPAEHDVILLFANRRQAVQGESLYRSGWTPYGVFRFVGEGQRGHMQFLRGNLALRDHRHNGKRIHLFVRVHPDEAQQVRYEGEFIYGGHFYKERHDLEQQSRRIIVFALKPAEVTAQSG